MPDELKLLYGNSDVGSLQNEEDAPGKCASCPQFLNGCLGEDAMRCPLEHLIKRFQVLRVKHHLSYDKLAERANLSKIGVMRVLRGEVKDPSYHTIQALAKVFVEEGGNQPCSANTASQEAETEKAAAIEEAEQLRQKLAAIEEAHEKERASDSRAIDYLKRQVERLEAQAETSAAHSAIRDRRKAIALVVMGILLFLSLVAIITALVYDKLNPDIGFFWRDYSAFYDFTRGAGATMPPNGLL